MTTPLIQCETELVDPEEWYLRALGQSHLDPTDGVVRTAGFNPTANDDGKLSGARSKMRSPESVFRERQSHGRNAVGTFGVTMAEVKSVGLRCVYDEPCVIPCPKGCTEHAKGACIEPLPKGHTYLDLRDFTKPPKSQKHLDVRNRLAGLATAHGFLFKP